MDDAILNSGPPEAGANLIHIDGGGGQTLQTLLRARQELGGT